MKEQDISLKQHYGNANPFRVPEGYFSDFNARIMQMLPTQESGPQLFGWHKYRLLLCTAATVCGLIFGVSVFLNHYQTCGRPGMAKTYEVKAHDQQVDEMMNYMMLDDDAIVSYMANY